MLQQLRRIGVVVIGEFQHFIAGAARIDQNPGGIFADEVAQYAQADVQFLIQQLRCAGCFGRRLQVAPQLVEIGDVDCEVRVVLRFGNRPDDIAAVVIRRQDRL